MSEGSRPEDDTTSAGDAGSTASAGETGAGTDGPLLIERRPDRMVIRLNRPEVRNAIDLTMVEALHEVCAELEAHPKVAILTGTGGTFAAGADIGQLRERRRDDALAGINSKIFSRILDLPMPVIGLIEGYALGGERNSRSHATSASAHRARRSATPNPGSASSPQPGPRGGCANSSANRGRRRSCSPDAPSTPMRRERSGSSTTSSILRTSRPPVRRWPTGSRASRRWPCG